MPNENTFPTKTGFCHILPDSIVLTREGDLGAISEIAVGRRILRTLIIYAVIALAMLYFAFEGYQNGEMLRPILFSLLSGYLIYGIIISRNVSAASEISRDKIKKILFKKGIKGLTRARFEVFFENENGKIKKRLIMLPGSLSEGEEETSRAIKIMKDENLMRLT